MEQAPAGDVGENQNGETDQLGNGGGGGGTCHAHVQHKDEDGVQDDVENSADAHSDHGQGSASFTAQALVHHKV